MKDKGNLCFLWGFSEGLASTLNCDFSFCLPCERRPYNVSFCIGQEKYPIRKISKFLLLFSFKKKVFSTHSEFQKTNKSVMFRNSDKASLRNEMGAVAASQMLNFK